MMASARQGRQETPRRKPPRRARADLGGSADASGRFPVQSHSPSAALMRRLRFSSTAIVLLLVSVPAHAQSPVYDVFRDYLDSLRAQAGIPGLAAAIVDSKQIVWQHAYGRQDLNRNLITRTDSPFHADGLTEMFT